MADPVARGYKTQCLMDYESVFGTLPDAGDRAGVILPINSFGLNVSRNKNSAQTLTGRRDPVEPFDGNTEVTGDVVVPVDVTAFGYWLKLLLGAPTTTGSGAPYTHVFKVSDTTPSGIVQCTYGTATTSYGLFSGVKCSSMSMTVGGDEELTATFSLAGRDATYSTTDYDSNASLVTLKRLNNFQATLKKDSVAFATCTQVDFTIDNGLDTSIRTIGGQGMVYDIPEGIMSVTGTMNCLFTDTTLLAAAKASTEMALELAIAIDASNSLTFKFPEVQLQYQGPTVDGPTGIMAEFPFVAYFSNSADDSVVVATLVNSTASY